MGENIKSYFKTLIPEGADRNNLKGKSGLSLGNQEGDLDELTGQNTGSETLGGTGAVETDELTWKD